MTNSPKVTIVIPNWNTQQWILGCLNGLREQRFQDFEVLLVDNGSTDNSIALTQQYFPEVKILALPENKGFAAAVNAGIHKSHSRYVALLNVDTVPQPGWLANLVKALDESAGNVGCAASKMLSLQNPNLIDDAGDILSWYGSAQKRGFGESASDYNQAREVFSACAGAALYRRAFLEKTGDFDEGFTSYLEDIDLGLRGRLLGYRCLYVPSAEILHRGQGASTPRPRYVYLMTRNRLALLFKNIPLELLLKHSWHILYGQFYYFLVYKHPWHSIAGTLAFLTRLPRLLGKRKRIQKRKKISNQKLDSLLSMELGEPSLRQIVRNRFLSNQ